METMIAQANACFVDEDYSESLKYYTQCIEEKEEGSKKDDVIADAYVKRSAAHLKLGNFSQALADADEAMALNASLKYAYFRKGYVQHGLRVIDAIMIWNNGNLC